VSPTRLEDAKLVLSELVSNAVRHREVGSQGKVNLAISVTDAQVRIEVSDDGPGFDPTSTTGPGFGLKIVERLSTRWGVESASAGTTVWAEVPMASNSQARMPPDILVRVLSQHVSDGITIQDGSGRLVYANEVVAKRSGYASVEDLLSDPAGFVQRFDLFDDLGSPLSPEDLPGRRVLADGRPERRLVRSVSRADGSDRWTVIQAEPVFGDDGRVAFVVNTVQDVTPLKLAEERLRRREESARFLAEAARVLTGQQDPEATLARVASLAVPRLADWCAIDLLEGPDRLAPVVIAHADPSRVEKARSLRERWPPQSEDQPGVWAAIRSRTPVTYEVTDELLASSVPDASLRSELRELGVSSVIIVPMLARGEVLGAITLVWEALGRTAEPEDLAVAQDLAAQAALALANARLYADREHVARALQNALLPRSLPHIPGFEFAARYWPAGPTVEVGGDFYDVFERPNGSFGLVVGDVCGKGAEAAAIMGVARQTVLAAGVLETRPSAMLAVLNEALLRDQTDLFCTACDIRGIPDAEGAKLTICLAGHPAPFHLRADGTVQRIGRHGTALGLFPDPRLIDSKLRLARGEAVVLFTDGLVERRGSNREEQLAVLLQSKQSSSAADLVAEIERWFLGDQGNELPDDAVVLVVRSL
jgi:serine phosphatase RsbU (regulator of sigma subunit)/PAS domain-containing protein